MCVFFFFAQFLSIWRFANLNCPSTLSPASLFF